MNPTQPPLPPMPPLPQMVMPGGPDPFNLAPAANGSGMPPAPPSMASGMGSQAQQSPPSQQNQPNQLNQPSQPPVSGGNTKQQVVERLKQANNVLITVSKNPSLDQLASSIGLTLMLSKLGKHATTVFSGEIPNMLEFLEPNKTIEKNTDSLRDFIIALDKSKADKLRYKVEDKVVKIFITPYRTSINQSDLEFSQGDFNVDAVVALGVHSNEELDEALVAHGRILHDATVITVMASNDVSSMGAINWNDPNASSLSEMLVSISESFKSGLLDPQMATAYLTGIVAETERFSNAKTSPKVMTMSAQLMAAGANQQLIAIQLEPPEPEPEPPIQPPLAEQMPEVPAAELPAPEAAAPAGGVAAKPEEPPKPPELASPEAVPMASTNKGKPGEQNTNEAGLIEIDHTGIGTGESGASDDALGFNMHDDSGVAVPDIHIDDQGNLKQIEQMPDAPAPAPDAAPAAPPAPETTPPPAAAETPAPPAPPETPAEAPAPEAATDMPLPHEGMKVIKPLSTREQLNEHKGLAEYMTQPPSHGGALTASGAEEDNEPTTDPFSLPAPSGQMLSHDAPPASAVNDEKRGVLPPMPGLMDTTAPGSPVTAFMPLAAPPSGPGEPPTPVAAPAAPTVTGSIPRSSLEMPEPPLISPNNAATPPPGPPPMMPGFDGFGAPPNPFGPPGSAASSVPPPSL